MSLTAPRTWVAAEIVTAAIMNTHVRDNLLALIDRHQIVRKSADESVASSTALQNDDELFFSVVAGQTYEFAAYLFMRSGSSAVDGNVGFSWPAGDMDWGVVAMDPAVAGGNVGAGTFQAFDAPTSGATVTGVGCSSTNVTSVVLRGIFECTTTGTVRLMWAQNTSSATAVTVREGSFIVANRMAA